MKETRTWWAPLILCLILFTPALGAAQEDGRFTVGVFSGIDNSDSLESFNQHEIALTYKLPWAKALDSGATLGTRLNVAVGRLDGANQDTLVVYGGPRFYWAKEKTELFAGINLTRIGEHVFGRENLGSLFHFTSQAGIIYRITETIGLCYRFQHMSNAGLDEKNPGLNMHMFGLNYSF